MRQIIGVGEFGQDDRLPTARRPDDPVPAALQIGDEEGQTRAVDHPRTAKPHIPIVPDAGTSAHGDKVPTSAAPWEAVLSENAGRGVATQLVGQRIGHACVPEPMSHAGQLGRCHALVRLGEFGRALPAE